MHFIESRPMGAAGCCTGCGSGWRSTVSRGRAKRAVPPGSKARSSAWWPTGRSSPAPSTHSPTGWRGRWPRRPADTYDERLYRAMDVLLGRGEELQRAVYYATADLFNLEVDLLLYDTTSSYFEMEDDDEERVEREGALASVRPRAGAGADQAAATGGQRAAASGLQGHSRDRRPDLAQVVVGLAVTRRGHPGPLLGVAGQHQRQHDGSRGQGEPAGLAAQPGGVGGGSRHGLRGHPEGAAARRGALPSPGERMRAGTKTVEEALSRAGRYQQVRDNLEVKEVVVGEGEARRALRAGAQPGAGGARPRGAGADPQADRGTSWSVCPAMARRTPRRCASWWRTDARAVPEQEPRGRLVIDRAKVKAEERMDGKYLIVTSDDTLSAEDVALGYKQLAEVERAWRTLKTDLDLRPMDHRKTERITAHVLLCWLALLLVRVIEVTCKQTWPRVEMDRCRGRNEVGPVRAAHRADGAAAPVPQGDGGAATVREDRAKPRRKVVAETTA